MFERLRCLFPAPAAGPRNGRPSLAGADSSVAVVLGTYNGDRYLSPLLDSITAQTRPPVELVACDDGSTDKTLSVLQDFARTAPFPVRIEENVTRLGFADNFLKAASLSLSPTDRVLRSGRCLAFGQARALRPVVQRS